MADDVTVDNGDLTDFVVATDDVSSKHYQYVKMAFGADGVATKVSSSDPVPATVITAPATERTGDSISAALAVDKLMNNLTAVSPFHAAIDAASSGDNTLVAAQGSGNIIVVHSLFLVAAGAVTVRFESGASGTALTGQMEVAANGGFILPFSPVGWFRTAANTLLNLELSGATSVDGGLTYSVVT